MALLQHFRSEIEFGADGGTANFAAKACQRQVCGAEKLGKWEGQRSVARLASRYRLFFGAKLDAFEPL